MTPIYAYIEWSLAWVDPWYWMTIGLLCFAITVIGFQPVAATAENGSFFELGLIKSRQFLYWLFLVIGVAFPASLWLLVMTIFKDNSVDLITQFYTIFTQSFFKYWTAPLVGFIGAWLISFAFTRYIIPQKSAFFRRFRVRQSGDELSDIRSEKEKFHTKNFLPSDYYKDDFFFYGLDDENKPVYIADDIWKTQNQKIIGPTQTGKGVNIGVQIDQAIRKGMCVIAIDPKPDKHLPHIMKKACDDTGREFIYLDLNEDHGKAWAPFVGGTARDRRNRVLYAFGLTDTGNESDYFKVKERGIIDRVFSEWDGNLESLSRILHSPDYLDDTSRTRSYLNEWFFLKSFSPENNNGVSIEKCLSKNAVLYVKASLKDSTVIKGATVLIMEIVQELMRLYSENKRQSHLYFSIDEVRFMISDMLADALATVAGFDANISIAYQSTLDIRNLKDKTLNAAAIEQSININCKTTLCYMAMDTETALWASNLSGTRQKSVTRMEGVKVIRHGAEVWDNKRMMNKIEENYIPANTIRMLPERTGLFFMPNELAQIIYTCWVPVELLFTPPQTEEINEVQEEEILEKPVKKESGKAVLSEDDLFDIA